MASLSAAISTADSAFQSASVQFSQSNLEDQYLEDLIAKIEKARAELKELQQGFITRGESYVWGDYWKKGNELANYLVEYRFYQESQVTSISEGRWEQNSGAGNYVKVTYVGKDQQTHTAYFDYITVDKNGNPLFDIEKQGGSEGSSDPKVIGGILVVQKTLGANGKFIPTNRKDVVSFGKKGYAYFSEKDFENGVDEYHSNRSAVTSASESLSELASEFRSSSESVSSNLSTNRSLSESLSSSSESDSKKQSESASSRSASESESQKNSQSASESASESARNSQSASASRSESQSQSTSESESGASASASRSASKSTSASESKAASESGSASASESESDSLSASARKSESESISSW
ncbi:MAG: hypothetical protein SPC23_11540, partial [Lachnospiraceae bacterium]|nr:hypothetical protein [Lachnospiraceae bacterium]